MFSRFGRGLLIIDNLKEHSYDCLENQQKELNYDLLYLSKTAHLNYKFWTCLLIDNTNMFMKSFKQNIKTLMIKDYFL